MSDPIMPNGGKFGGFVVVIEGDAIERRFTDQDECTKFCDILDERGTNYKAYMEELFLSREAVNLTWMKK